MRAVKSGIQFLICAVLSIVVIALLFFGPAPNVQAQENIPTPTPEFQIQIIGGGLADPGEWPWQVALVIAGADPPWYGQFCGGSLIHPQWVLTAAHCVTEANGSVSNPNTIDVIAGIYDLWLGSGYQRQNGLQIIRHPSYVDNNTFNHDIALIKLDNPITIGGSGSTKTAVIPLAQSSFGSLEGWTGTVTGWGNTNPSGETWPDQLQEVELPILSNATCGNYNHWGYGITANMLCAGYDAGDKSSCQGDSGGPLVVKHTETWHLAGIVSFGPEGCAVPYLPSVFTRVSRYVSWVNSQADIINPFVSGIVRADPNPTNAASVDFTVTFSENVSGVDLGDFDLTMVGVSGAALSSISGSGSLYTVTVATGSGEGTIRLDLVDDDTILDTANNKLGGMGAGNGNFTSGEVYTVDRTPPTVSSITRLNSNPSATLSVSFLVTFSEPVTGVGAADFSLATTGLTGAFISNVIGSGATRTAVINTGIGDGTIRLDVLDDDTILDAATNPLDGGYTGGETYTIDKPDLPPPALRSPRDNMVTKLTTPTFRWTSVRGGSTYEIEIATDDIFSNIVDGGTFGTLSFTPTAPLVDDVYYWHVRARTAGGQPGAWSVARSFTIDTTGPDAPALTSPSDGASIRAATFRWQAIPAATAYEFQLDSDPGFADPVIISSIVRGASRRLPVMPMGTYSWRVRARDALGNWGAWSAPFTVNITGS